MPESDSDIKNKDKLDNQDQLIAPDFLMDAPIGIYTTTPEGRFLSANRTMAKMLGYDTPKELIESITDLSKPVYVNPDDRQNAKTLLETYGEVSDYECQWLRRNGKALWVSLNARAVKDESGNILYYQGFASNIAKRKHNEEDLRKIEWMLSGDQSVVVQEISSETHAPPYDDLTNLNISRLILDSVGKETLRNIVNEYLEMLGTSAAVYEKNGDYALGIFSSSWCRFMDQASRSLCNTDDNEEALASGKWLCHESCWNISKQCIETGNPVDAECSGGLRLYTVPVRAGDDVIGAISFGYGNPPTDSVKLDRLASKYGVSKEMLRQNARSYETRPPFIIDLAMRRIRSAAYLIGEIVGRKQIEKSLEETIGRLREREAFTWTVLDNLPIGLSINTVDERVDISYMNDNFPKIYRTPRQAFERGDSFWNVVYENPVFRKEIMKRVLGDCASGDPDRMQWDDIPFTRNGETFYICARNIPLADENVMISTVWDVTNRNRIEEKRTQALADLGRRTEELEALLDGAKSVIEKDDFYSTARRLFDVACDITGAHSGYVALLNESGEENEVLFLESGGLTCTVDPHLPMPIRGLRSKAYETGQAVFENDFMNTQWVDYMPAGHVVLKNVMFAPLNIERKTVGLIGLANKDGDFTDEDRQMAEALGRLAAIALRNSRNLAALEASEEKYRSILEKIEDGYFEVDLAGNLTFFNDSMCRILGYESEELLGLNYKEYTDQNNQREVYRYYNHIFKTGEPLKAFEWECIRQNGEKCYLDTSVSLMKNRHGEAVGFRGIARDVTNRKASEAEKERLLAQLYQAQKMESVGRLAGGVAHDFNNMLTIINGYAEMMADVLPSSDPMYESVQEIQDAGKRSAIIVRKLLAFARKQTIDPVPMNLNDSVSGMLKMLHRLIGANIDLLWKPCQNAWLIKMDFSQIDQILANLVVNAHDAIAGIGKITIETGTIEFDEQYCAYHTGFVTGEFVMLAVSDNGCGMDKYVLDNLFEPFFTTKEIGKGTGLGLPTVYGIVKQNNGFINVYSEPGQGTTVRIYFPRFSEEADIEEQVKKKDILLKGRGETVLVLEDETVVLNLTRIMLERLGYKVITSNSPSEAMELAKAHDGKIDLLLSDIIMPEMNGREFAEQLNDLYPVIKTLFMSGYTENVIAHHTILDEGVNFIEKPFSIHKLAGKVREVLSST